MRTVESKQKVKKYTGFRVKIFLILIGLCTHENAYFSMTRQVLRSNADTLRRLSSSFCARWIIPRRHILLGHVRRWLRIQGSHSADSFVSHSRPDSTKWTRIKARPSTRRFFLVARRRRRRRGEQSAAVCIFVYTCVYICVYVRVQVDRYINAHIFSPDLENNKRGFICTTAQGNNLRNAASLAFPCLPGRVPF